MPDCFCFTHDSSKKRFICLFVCFVFIILISRSFIHKKIPFCYLYGVDYSNNVKRSVSCGADHCLDLFSKEMFSALSVRPCLAFETTDKFQSNLIRWVSNKEKFLHLT